ncbi:hypothetical protein ACA910_001768 [Epithemia clementina (nom. ined.)]
MCAEERKRRIIQALERYSPSLVGDSTTADGAMIDYIVAILDDEDSFTDVESLQETLLPFIGGDPVIASKLIEDVRPQDGTTNPTKASQSHDVQRLETVKQVLSDVVQKEGSNAAANDNDVQPPHNKSEVEENLDKKSKKGATRSKRKPNQQRVNKEGTKNLVEEFSDETPVEDDASAWNECKDNEIKWGGRGRGGRGEYAGAVNHVKSNIHLSNITVALPNGTELLSNSLMDIQKGHRYGLIGRNGVGKSTLLQRLANKSIPGMPHDMRVLLVQQQVDGSEESPLQVLIKADVHRIGLLREQRDLEASLESSDELSEDKITEMSQRLGDIVDELDAIDADRAETRALDILKGLQFSLDMVESPTRNLSGGWRMRLSLARALFVKSDLLLLDEVSNHIVLAGLDWLIRYLNQDNDRTMIIVSHDRSFLDSVCTDIIHMNHQTLKYHPGNFSEFERQTEEKSAREAQILDAAERQRNKAQAFVQKQEAMARSKSADPNKQRQAKMIKEKKLDRIGNYREDGKKYKLFSMKQLSENHVRLAQKVAIEVDYRF